jgi:hypothetical protein
MDKTQVFIEKASKIYGDKYDYSKVDYINAKTKVIIICKEHGDYLQTPNKHLQNRNCQKCGKIKLSNYKNYNTKNFIEKAIKIHGNRYDYSKVEYIKSNEKITVICKEHGEFKQVASSHLVGYGCKKCKIYKIKFTTNEFIIESKKIHKEKYDYSLVEYKGCKQKIKIICKNHGIFEQIPKSHLYGMGCRKCGQELTGKKNGSSYEEFINRSKEIYEDKYDYSKVKYLNATTKVIIICKEHGEFTQIPMSHLRKMKGCKKCNGRYMINTNEFIIEAKKKHGNKYDYSKVNINRSIDKISIICKIHGEFEQLPSCHLKGKGCFKCGYILSANAKKSNTEKFIEKAIKIHCDKYNYSKVNYEYGKKRVIIICKEHGEFTQTPEKHLLERGCSKCNSSFSKPQIQWLDFLENFNNITIQHAMNDGEFRIPTTRYFADGYCKENNTIYEFHGDYWHGNPNKFNPNELNKTVGKTYKELYEDTLKREQEIKNLGFNLEVMWESDWNKINKSIKKLQKIFKVKNNLN